ncbi:MAG: hypothetical protein ABIP35_10205 [Ginsengibacter sp.]
MELHLKIIGVLLMALALVHAIFPKYFNWKTELIPLSIINRQLVYVHSFFIALIVLLMGLLCLTSSYDLVHTLLGKQVSLGIGIFWMARLFIQLFGYSSKLWRGKRFETSIHIVFTIFWTYLTVVFMLIWMGLSF